MTCAGSALAAPASPQPQPSPEVPDRPILRLDGLTKRFQGLKAIDSVSLSIAPGSISTIIGPNGAGKSTLFNMVTGYLRPTGGQIWFGNKRADAMSTVELSQAGVARAFQIAKPFHGLTVFENVLVGALFGRNGERDSVRAARDALALTGLTELSGELASSLPVGHLRRLELARAVATRAKLVLADEPCAGLNPTETREIAGVLQEIRRRGATVVLVEHDMRTVMEISDYVYVIAAGRLIAQGIPTEVAHNPVVIEAYLGRRREHTRSDAQAG